MDDISCRIVIVSSSLSKGDILVQNLKRLSAKAKKGLGLPVGDARTPAIEDDVGDGEGKNANVNENESLVEPKFYPWTISNRYYTANVHFSLHSLSRTYPAVFEGIPALVVAWTHGEPIEEYMKDLQKAMGGYEPEILLGVRLPGDKETGGIEEEDDLDSMMISYGFEYIDASRPLDPTRARNEDEDGVPHLPRVLDALSAFMWPSMSTNTDLPHNDNNNNTVDGSDTDSPSSSQHTSPRPPRHQPTLDHIINRDPFAILQALEELDAEFNFGEDNEDGTGGYHETLKQLAMLEAESKAAGIMTDSPPSGFTDLSRTTNAPNQNQNSDLSIPFGLSETRSLKPKISIGFEDDFSAFVTAPPEDDDNELRKDFAAVQIHSGRTSPDYDLLLSADPAGDFASRGSLYRSLGSMSDLGDLETSPNTV
ncbi:hypothetical protein CC2G_012487 [Coprinopsis cinerea AmutBmut pab1-1]|nr:hypothetical protein CC2G_012487 [Coprinopsis cinerea AmutBmut pab1-1]